MGDPPPDPDLAAPRGLSGDESARLRGRLAARLDLASPRNGEDAAVLLEYAMDMVETHRTVGHVVEELQFLEMPACDGETARKIGACITQFFQEMAEGSQLCGEEEWGGEEGGVVPAVVETSAAAAKSDHSEVFISTIDTNSDDGKVDEEGSVPVVVKTSAPVAKSNHAEVLILTIDTNSDDSKVDEEGPVPAVVETSAPAAKSDHAEVRTSTTDTNSDDGKVVEEGPVPAVVETSAAAAKSDYAELLISATDTNSNDGNVDGNSGSNEENIELSCGRTTDNSEHQNLCKRCKKSRQTHCFKDPFPSLSPMPLQSLQSLQSRLNAQTDARHNHAVQDNAPPSSLATSLMKSTKSTEGSSSESSVSPPHVEVAPLSPPRSWASAALPAQTSPLRVASDGDKKSWVDPFPTPDVPAHSRCRFSTPCSSRVKADSDDDPTPGDILNPDWEAVLSIPKIPLAEVTSPTSVLRTNGAVATSSPQLHSAKAANISVRKVSSLPMVKRPSLEEIFWGSLKLGPDGNGLEIDYDVEKERREKEERRDGLNAMLSREPLDHHGGGLGVEPLRRRSSNSPVETSWKELGSPMDPFPDGIGGSMSSESNNTNGHLEHHSVRARVTINNVTGANLAKEVKKIIVERKGVANGGAMSPKCLSVAAWKNIKTSKAVVNTRELVLSPVRSVRNTGQRAAKLVRTTHQKLKERKELRRQRRLARMNEPPRSWWIVIPSDHPYKIAWDVLTMIWAILGAHRTHVRIRDRVFDQSPLIILTEIWFTVDILLNFVTEHKTSKGQVIRDGKAVWARYLTTWFIIDILSLIPWERVWVRPVVEKIKKRNFFQKTFFRSKAVVRVSRVLRGRHIKLFGRVSKQTGTPLRRLVTLVIKYLPKYLVFLRNMKGALVVRALRFIHWLHNMYKKIWVKARNYARHGSIMVGHPILGLIRPSEAESESDDDDDDDDDESDIDSESIDEFRNDSLLLDDSDRTGTPARNFRRTISEGSPSALRRSLSQAELLRRY